MLAVPPPRHAARPQPPLAGRCSGPLMARPPPRTGRLCCPPRSRPQGLVGPEAYDGRTRRGVFVWIAQRPLALTARRLAGPAYRPLGGVLCGGSMPALALPT